MANVYEGATDGRQSADEDEPLSRFRPRYRALSDDEKSMHDGLKECFSDCEVLIEALPAGRYRAMAMTALEESCMWAVKALTANRG